MPVAGVDAQSGNRASMDPEGMYGTGAARAHRVTGLLNGRHLRAARALAGVTQARLADIAGLHPKSVAYWERQPEIGVVEGVGAIPIIIPALARLGVSVEIEHDGYQAVALVRGDGRIVLR